MDLLQLSPQDHAVTDVMDPSGLNKQNTMTPQIQSQHLPLYMAYHMTNPRTTVHSSILPLTSKYLSLSKTIKSRRDNCFFKCEKTTQGNGAYKESEKHENTKGMQ